MFLYKAGLPGWAAGIFWILLLTTSIGIEMLVAKKEPIEADVNITGTPYKHTHTHTRTHTHTHHKLVEI